MSRADIIAIAFLLGAAANPFPQDNAEMAARQTTGTTQQQAHPYAGMWVTADGHIRHNLLPNGRYDEAGGNRAGAYQGRYEVRGDEIFYWDDTGVTADGKFVDDVLYHAGMILRRKSS